jgi:hypothetical protein
VKSQAQRLARLEEKEPPMERQFIAWGDQVWTPEEQAEAIRRDPDERVFWKSLLDCVPVGKPWPFYTLPEKMRNR